MRDYQVRVDLNGVIQTHTIIAEDASKAATMGSKIGKVVSIRASSPLKALFVTKLKPEERIEFMQKLATMVGSKVPLMQALETAEEAYTGAIRRVAASIKAKLGFGANFADVLKTMPMDFPESISSLVDAGMKSGDFHTALKDAAEFDLEMLEIRKSSMLGLISAIMNFMIGALLTLGTAYGFAPYFLNTSFMKASDEVDIDWILTMSDVMGIIIAAVMVIVVLLFVLTALVKPINPGFADRIIRRLPMYRDLSLNKTHYIVFYTLSRLVDSRIPINDAMKVVINSSPKGEVRQDLIRSLGALEAGNASWAMKMENINAIDKASLVTSQDVTDVVRAIRNVANSKKDDYARSTRRTVPILQAMGYAMMATSGFLLFAITTIPTVQVMNSLL
jgi:type II secretory pathway component PulF